MTLRLMCVIAHPDDESLGFGGTLAKYAAEGAETHVVAATRGERGRYKEGEEHPGPEALGRIRETELRRAAQELGVHDVRFLDYRDAELDRADPEEAVARIVGHIRRAKPHVVLTFDPAGAYGHPDHIAICQLTTAAVMSAADPSYDGDEPSSSPAHRTQKLYYMAWSPQQWAAYEAAFKKLVSTVDGVERQASPWPTWALTTVIDTEEYWPTVWRAVRCHESQLDGYRRLKDLPPEHHRALWGTQSFYRVFSLVNGGRTVESDLFDGLR